MRKILAAAEKLPRNHIPDGVPATLSDWLRALRLSSYIANFEHLGYGDADLPMIEGLCQAATGWSCSVLTWYPS